MRAGRREHDDAVGGDGEEMSNVETICPESMAMRLHRTPPGCQLRSGLRNTARTTRGASEPSATRMPISRVRRATLRTTSPRRFRRREHQRRETDAQQQPDPKSISLSALAVTRSSDDLRHAKGDIRARCQLPQRLRCPMKSPFSSRSEIDRALRLESKAGSSPPPSIDQQAGHPQNRARARRSPATADRA